MSHNIYRGVRIDGIATVTRNGEPFDPKYSLAVRNHSPTGFEWGYQGSGPAQLALAILLEETDRETAERYYQRFKREVIAHLERPEHWTLTSLIVQDWLADSMRARQPVPADAVDCSDA